MESAKKKNEKGVFGFQVVLGTRISEQKHLALRLPLLVIWAANLKTLLILIGETGLTDMWKWLK